MWPYTDGIPVPEFAEVTVTAVAPQPKRSVDSLRSYSRPRDAVKPPTGHVTDGAGMICPLTRVECSVRKISIPESLHSNHPARDLFPVRHCSRRARLHAS